MKVFISPQRADSKHAEDIARHLQKFHAIDSYLDVADPTVGTIRGPELAEHVRRQMEFGKSV